MKLSLLTFLLLITLHKVDSKSLFDVFQTGKPEWELVFRGTPGVQRSAYHAYMNYQVTYAEPGCKTLDIGIPCFNHYRNNNALDYWSNVDEVALVLYKNGVPAVYVVFNGNGSNNVNWFDNSRVIRTSFTDFEVFKNSSCSEQYGCYFSLQGSEGLDRRFYINYQFGGCDLDAGWIVAVEKMDCVWTRRNDRLPRFLYAKGGNMSNYMTGETGDADFLAIFTK